MVSLRANGRRFPRLVIIWPLIVLVLIGSPAEMHADAPFTAISAGLTGVSWSYVGWGDYDRDGDLDILLTGSEATKIYRNDGGGDFTDIGASLAPGGHQNAEWGDYDRDGDLDILLTGTHLYRNDGGTFKEVSTDLPDVSAGAASWGDFDNDGDLDVAISGRHNSSDLSGIYRNNGGTSFTDTDAAIPNVFDGSMAWGDYDGDGDLDLLMTGISSTLGMISRVYRNDNGVFKSSGIALTGVGHSSAVWGDYDNDGDLDILLSGMRSDSSYIMRIYRNSGGNFTSIGAALDGQHYSTVRWGDYDNDGDLDILQPHESYSRIYRNDNGTFVNIGSGLLGVSTGAAAWGDYDKDGDLDVLLTGSGSSKVHRNDLNLPNPTPSTPDGLAVDVIWPEVALSWQASTDTQTPPRGLTYNLRLGTSPGGVNVVPPMADPVGGFRHIPVFGNQQHGTMADVNGLSPGTYYWSVQAVDSAFAGSLFSAEGSFAMGTPTPAPSPTPTPTPTPDGIPPSGSFTINRGAAQTESALVRLDVIASDSGGGPLQMRLRNNEDPWGAWQGYQPVFSWQLPAINNQMHTVHVELRDGVDNRTALAQSIDLDFYPRQPGSANASLHTDTFGTGERKRSDSYCLGGTTLQVMSPGVLQSPTFRWLAGFWSRLFASTPRVPEVPKVSIRDQDADVVLSWPHILVDTGGVTVDVTYYAIRRADLPYFTPAGQPYGIAEAPGSGSGTVTFTDSGAFGDGLQHYYAIFAVSSACRASGSSDRVGVFHFTLVPGGDQ